MTTEIEDMVNSYTSNDFSSDDVTKAILTSSKFAGIKEGRVISITALSGDSDSDDQDNLGIAMLAVNILINSRNIIKSRTDTGVTMLTMEQMYTDEIKQLLEVGDTASVNLIRVTSNNPTDDWVSS